MKDYRHVIYSEKESVFFEKNSLIVYEIPVLSPEQIQIGTTLMSSADYLHVKMYVHYVSERRGLAFGRSGVRGNQMD